MDTLAAIKERRSVKHYNPDHKMPEAEIKVLFDEVVFTDGF